MTDNKGTTMLSYHNDPAIKAKYTLRFAQHREADAVIQGTGYANGRGCFVGCTLKNYDHSRFPIELGWPEWLAQLADAIFEGLPQAEAPQFGSDLLDAVPVGVDLDPVRWQLAIARHERQLTRLDGNAEPYAEQVRKALRGVIEYCRSQLVGDATESAAWSAAESAWSAESAAWSAAESAWSAESAARSAAESAAWSAESAARSAAESAESAARSAAESAAWSAESAARSAAESAESAARSAEYQVERDTLLNILRGMGKAND